MIRPVLLLVLLFALRTSTAEERALANESHHGVYDHDVKICRNNFHVSCLDVKVVTGEPCIPGDCQAYFGDNSSDWKDLCHHNKRRVIHCCCKWIYWRPHSWRWSSIWSFPEEMQAQNYWLQRNGGDPSSTLHSQPSRLPVLFWR